MNKYIGGFLWKEYKIMQSRILTSVMSGTLLFGVLYIFFERIMTNSNTILCMVDQKKVGIFSMMIFTYISAIFIMRFREEKLSGIMEIELSLPITIKKIVVAKLVSYLIIINIFLILSLIGGCSLVYIFFNLNSLFIFDFRYIIIQNAILFIYGIMVAYGTWCCSNLGYKLMLLLSNIMICIFLQNVWKLFMGININGVSIVINVSIIILVSMYCYFKFDKEKAILSC